MYYRYFLGDVGDKEMISKNSGLIKYKSAKWDFLQSTTSSLTSYAKDRIIINDIPTLNVTFNNLMFVSGHYPTTQIDKEDSLMISRFFFVRRMYGPHGCPSTVGEERRGMSHSFRIKTTLVYLLLADSQGG